MTTAEPGTTLAPAGAGVWSWDRTSGRVDWDTGVEALYGLAPGSFEGTFEAWTARVHPDDLGPVLDRVNQAFESHTPLLFDHRCLWPDGSVHWLECRGVLVFDDSGEPVGATGIAIDIDYRRLTEEERRSLLESERAARRSLESAWGRLARLHSIAVSLAAAVSVREVGEVLVSQGVEALHAQGGFFSLVDHETEQVILQASQGARPDVIEHYRSIPFDQVEPITEAVTSGSPVYVTSEEDRNLRYPDLPAQGARAFVIYPIQVGDRVDAVLAYGYRKEHDFSAADEEMLDTLAGMSAQAIQRARLHDSTDASATRASQLESVIAALAGATTRREVADIVVNGLIPSVGAAKGTLFLVDNEHQRLRALAVHGYEADLEPTDSDLPLDVPNPPGDAVRSRMPVEVRGSQDFIERYPEMAERLGVSEVAATSLTFPLIVEGQVVGTLGLGFDADHVVTADERRHLVIVSGVCAQALGRAQALEEARAIGERLRQIDQITDAALARLSLDDLFEELPARIAHVTGCEAVRLTLIDETGEYLEVRGHYGIPEDRLTRVPVGRGLSGTIAKLGTPRVIEDISQHEVVGPPFPDTVTSEAGVPLRSGDRIIGVLDVGAGPDRPLTEDDIELLERAGDRIATAIQRSRAYELERTERARSDLVSRLSDVINRVGPLGEQLEGIAELLCQELADCCVLSLQSDYGRPIHTCGHRDPSRRESVRSVVSAHTEFLDETTTLAASAVKVYSATPDAPDEVDDPAVRELLGSLDLAFALSLPLRGVSGPIGRAILGRTREGGEFAPDDSSMLEEVADRIGAALEGKITFERHRTTAITLQHSLLPSELPTISGLEIAARYWPASESFEVGGDFYDVIELDDDRWGIMVGDVSGKGVEAAAMTGIARHTARAAARHGVEPSGVLQWVHEAFMEQAETTETYCTAVYGDLARDGADFRFRFAVGGHPLPIYRSGTGEVGYTGHPGTVLGLIEPVEVTEVEVALHPGDWMVIYTDGVTDVPVANAITESELLDIVGRATRRSAQEALAALDVVLQNRYGHYRSRDDTAILILRIRNPDRRDRSGSFSES